MGVLTATIRFTNPIPTSTDLVAVLCQHTGELVSYKEEMYELACPVLTDVSSIMAIADPQENVWELRTFHLKGSYFWYASLVVMEKLGGEQVDFDGNGMPCMPAPVWAYKTWQLAKKEYRWRNWRRPTWLTLDEARRLGVE
jgi:hypothetical protein